MNISYLLRFFVLNFLLIGFLNATAQDPNRYKDQVDKLYNTEYDFSPEKKRVVFTGSSSIRMWKDVTTRFPEYNIVNNGFGGSHFSDLIYFYDQLITKQKPDILFIYEGDNDIAANKKVNKIYKEAKSLVNRILTDLPETKVVLISPKPSIARQSFEKKYRKLNRKLSKFCQNTKDVEFADVWSVMFDKNGKVYEDIFIEDGLHMNKKGYDLWTEVIGEFL